MLRRSTACTFLLVLLVLLAQGVFSAEPTREELSAAFAAKVLASAVFVSEREVEEALEMSVVPLMGLSGFRREDLTQVEVDRETEEVSVSIRDSPLRTARFFGDQGCVVLPRDSRKVFFEPVKLRTVLPDGSTQPWPMGEVLPANVRDPSLDAAKLDAAVDAAFAAESHTAAMVILHRGQLVAERYGAGAHQNMRLESWSMGKSLTAILYALTVAQDGPFDPFLPAPIPQWQKPGDERGKIQVAHLLRMSSGLDFSGTSDPPAKWEKAHPDHFYIYSGAVDVFRYSARRPVEFPPNTVGRYRNCDPLLIGALVKHKVEARGENYLSFPQRALFDRIGIRKLTLEPDPYGNFVMTGFEYGRARDWARLGLLMVNDGVWMGERILPAGFVEFVSTPAPAWENRQYGGLFWVNGDGRWAALPKSAYYMAGQGGQHVIIIPSHDLVVVRMGHQLGLRDAGRSLNRALALLMEAIKFKTVVP